MFFNRKKEPDPVEEIETEIWQCAVDTCSGWARKDFFFSNDPLCPFCEEQMVSEMRMLPILFDRMPNQ